MPNVNVYSVYPMSNNLLVVVFSVWITLMGGRMSNTCKMMTGFTGSIIIMLILPFAARLPSGTNFWVVFALFCAFGACSALIQNTTYSMAGALPPRYFAIVIISNAIVGLFCNVLRGVTLLVYPVLPA